MGRIRLIIEYDGTGYVGWQIQPNGIAVQYVIERELNKLTGENCVLHASGRTDSGVHAYAQVAHFDTDSRIPPEKFAYALNAGLPPDIRIKYSGASDSGFHSRFDVIRKSYRYSVLNSPHSSAFTRNTALHVHYPLNTSSLNEAAGLFVGEHDFMAFKSSGSRVDNTVRSIYRSTWRRSGDMLYYEVTGSGFLYNMVRIMVGTMLEIGMGRYDKGCITEAFENLDRSRLGVTAPAKGLALARVE